MASWQAKHLTPQILPAIICAATILAVPILSAAPKVEIRLKAAAEVAKPYACLADLIESHTLSAREAEKLIRYCRIEIKTEQTVLPAQDIELHAWAAGIIPDKIFGTGVTVHRVLSSERRKAIPQSNFAKLRRGTSVRLMLRSENMSIARNAVLLADSFPGETVELRPDGTRKIVRAKLNADKTAEFEP